MKYSNLISIKLAVILTVTTLFVSCEYDGVNVDPTRPGGDNVPLVAITPTMQTQTHRNITAALARLSGIITQQWIGFDAQQVAFTTYVIGESDINGPWTAGLYTGAMRDCVDMIGRAENNPQTRGVAKIYLAVNLGITTDAWGDVPFTEAFQGTDNLFPTYDGQESVYADIIRLLNEAKSDLSMDEPGGVKGTLVDQSAAGWIQTANALLARFYIHQTSVNPNAAQLALDAINDGAMTSNEDISLYQFGNSQNEGNALALFGIQRPNTMIIDPEFVELMQDDPRMPLYMVDVDPSDPASDFLYYQNDNNDLFWAQLDSPSPLMSYWEQKFIEAEAMERTGGDGTTALNEAITANMQFLGISDADIATYLGTVTLGGTTEEDIEVIITEKYKSLYGSAPTEIWGDYRRTGYPALTPKDGGENGVNPSGVIPRRFLYPISERQSNPDSYQAAIDAQGGHLLDDDIWIYPSN